jgi:two-component system CheB/CheR fusion protein
MMDQAEVGISLSDRGGVLRYGNNAFRAMAGLSDMPAGESPTFRDLTDPADWERCEALMRRMFETGQSFSTEKRLRRTDGSVVWVRNHVSPWRDADGTIAGAFAVTMDLTERHVSEEALRQSEKRYRAIVENARDYAIFSLAPDGTVNDWLGGAEAVFGWRAQEIVGLHVEELFTPEDRANRVPAAELAAARTCDSAPDVRWHQRKNGERVFIEGKTLAMRAQDGTLLGFLKIGQDVTERRQSDEALRQSERRFRQFSDASADVLWIRNVDSMQFEHVSAAFEHVYGVPIDSLHGNDFLRWAELIFPDDREAAIENLRLVASGCSFTHEFRIVRGNDDQLRWVRDSLFPLMDEYGAVWGVGGIGEDVTEARQSADRLRILNSELQHRTRNLIAVVRAVAHSTLEASKSLEDFNRRFVPRLDALSRVQGLLSRATGGNVDFESVVRAELNAHGALDLGHDRVQLSGPPGIGLLPNSVQTVVLALHELATNALKYGALSQPEARLRVTWDTRSGRAPGQERLHIEWHESGVSMPNGVAPGTGYGRELIEHALPYQLGAATRYELGKDGVHCSIDLPLSGT